MKKIFTFLVAFLTTLSGAVWGQTYPTAGSGSGTQEDPYILDLNDPKDIGDVNWQNVGSIVDWHGDSGLTDYADIRYNAFQIKEDGYYKVINSAGSDAISTYRIDIDNGNDWNAGEVRPVELNVTLILDNVNIEVTNPKDRKAPIWIEDNGSTGGEASEHKVTIQLVGKNSLTFKQDEMDGAAIATNENCDLTITGNGYLRAEGQVGIGMVEGISGDITINGGTVVAVGHNGPGFGGSDDNGTNLIINGNTLVISAGSQDIGEMRENLVKGIYYDSTSDYNSAMVHGDVTLDSQFPSSEELQNILGSDLKIDFASDGQLTLGEGVYFRADKLVNPTTNEAKLKAYKVTYDLNKSVGENEPIQITDESPYASIYAGANVSLAALPEDARTEAPSWQAMAWGQNNSGTYAKVTKTGSTTPTTSVANNQINATTIWAVDTWTDINVTQNETLDETIQLFYPQEAASLFTISNGTDLNQYGAALGTGDNANKVVAHTTGAIASPNEQATNVELTISGDNKKITLPFKVNKYAPSLKDATITVKKDGREYNSEPIKEVSEIISKIMVGGSEVAFTNVEMQFKKDNEGQEGDDLSSAPEEVGKYWVSVKAKAGATSYQGESKYVQFEITPKTVTVKSVADEVYTINGDGTFDWSDNVTLEGLIDGDNVTIKYNGTPEGSDYVDTPGTYTVSYTISKEGDDAGNYTIPESATGKLIVKKTGNENDPINPGDPEGEDTEIKIDDGEGGWEWSKDGYTRVYDGDTHSLKADNLVYVRQKGGENEWVAVPASAIEVTSVTPDQAIKNQGTYTVKLSIAETKDILYSGTVGDITLVITPRPMVIDINKLTAEDVAGITGATPIDITTDDVTFKAVEGKEESGIVEKEKDDAVVNGTITVTPAESTKEGKKAYTITVDEEDFKLYGVDGGKFAETNYTATYTYNGKSIEDGTITETIDDITPGEDTDIDDGDGDDSNWEWNTDANAYVVIYDGKGHGVATITVDGDKVQPTKVTYKDADGVELLNKELPTDAGRYTAEVEVTIGEESKTKIFPLCIEKRPLGVHFNLDDYILEAGGVYDASSVVEYEPVVIENVLVGGKLAEEDPVLEGTIKVADTPNSEDKYAVTFEGVKLGTDEDFDAENYEPTYYLNGELLELDENGDKTVGGEKDPEQGIDISEPDDETGISSIGTKRYRLYLANKDYNVADAKADYAAEGLELFSRHDKKYTKAGGSFTVWYEKDGVANAGGYRIFWSNKANGDYKEVKFDTVSEYFQIRNVQSNVYVKIYAADGFPVGNEEISAADYRAYAQPNKIVVITPQPTDVQIISMAGAVVATDKVTGQREFTNLTEGVYIVRMGETVVKLQVRK